MYLVGQLHFPVLEKWPYVGDFLWNSATHSLLTTSGVCSRGAPYVVCVETYIVMGLTILVVLVGGAGSWLTGG